jgi:hypothetical protein
MPPGVDSAEVGLPLRHPNDSRPTCKNDGHHVLPLANSFVARKDFGARIRAGNAFLNLES